MAEFDIKVLELGISKLRETTYNTSPTDGADYIRVKTTSTEWPTPYPEKVSDAGKIGAGYGYPTQYRNDYWKQPQIQVIEDMNTDFFAYLLARALGGSVIATQVVAGPPVVNDWEILMQNIAGGGAQMPSSGFFTKIGGYDTLFSGMCVTGMTVAQQKGGTPQGTFQLDGSGKYTKISTITPVFTVPAPLTKYNYMISPATRLTYFNGVSTVDLCGRILNWQLQLNKNAKVTDRRPCDPPIDGADYTKGAYQNRMLTGVPSAQLTVDLSVDADQAELVLAQDNQDVTNFKIAMQGEKLAAGPERAEIDLIMPIGVITAIPGTSVDDIAAIRLTVDAKLDPVTNGLIKARVRNLLTALE
jgi:hypothetical protein